MRENRRKFSLSERKYILTKANNRCAHCGKKLDEYTMTVEHVFPVQKGGNDDEYNLLPLCYDCNEEKGNLVIETDFYPFIKEEEKEKYAEYNNFASFDFRLSNSIIGWDYVVFKYIPPAIEQLLQSGRRIKEKVLKYNYSIAILRPAVVGQANEIFSLLKKNEESKTCTFQGSIYRDRFAVESAIVYGNVFVLEVNKKIKGVFFFEKFGKGNLGEVPNYVQFNNLCEMTNTTIKYVLTCVTIDYSVRAAVTPVMNYFEEELISRRIMPMYYDFSDIIVAPKYRKEYIKLPVNIGGFEKTLECKNFKSLEHSISQMLYKQTLEYTNISSERESIAKEAANYFIKYTYQRDAEEDIQAKKFFERYPKLYGFLKPEEYELYNQPLPIVCATG